MSRVLADNWSLQNTAELLTNGLGNDLASIITIDKSNNTHNYESIDYDIIRIEALFDLLNDIVLKDEIIVDDRFINVWSQSDGPLVELHKAGIIQPFPFLAAPEKLQAPTDALVKRLCATSSLESEHKINNLVWASEKTTPYPVLSSTLWGGAGMLARSHVYECNYTPHPLRRRLFTNAGIFMERNNAGNQLQTLIHTKRIQLFGKKTGTDSIYNVFLQLPPIPFRVIEESSNVHDLFRVAMEVRNELKELRQWLNQFQNAIDNEDVTDMLKHKKLFSSVSDYVDQRISGGGTNRVDMSLGLGLLKFSIKGDPLNTIKNRFGVRSAINSLIFDKPGKQALKKFLRFLGDADSEISYKVYQHFTSTLQ